MFSFKDIKWMKVLRIGLIILGAMILLGGIFTAGMFVGFRKARYSYDWGENYQHLFGGPKRGPMMDRRADFNQPGRGPMMEFKGEGFINSGSAVGKVIKSDSNTLYIMGDDNVEKNVLVNTTTLIRHFRDAIKLEDIKANDDVVIFGSPSSSGQLEAKLIRVLNN